MSKFNDSATVDAIISEISFEISEKSLVRIPGYSTRLNILYYVLFEIAEPYHLEKIKSEVIQCELSYLSLRPLENYEDLTTTPELLISMYADVAHTLASLRLTSLERCDFIEKQFLCAEYLSKNFASLMDSGFVSKNIKAMYDKDVKDAIFDFAYAAGNIERENFWRDPMFCDIAIKDVFELRKIVKEGTLRTSDLKKMLNI
jgi:hypothetical protein